MISENNASNNTLLRRYVHGPGVDEPLVQYDYSSPTSYTRSWYVTDQKGSITGRTNSSGTSLSVNRYTQYGDPDAANTGRFHFYIPVVAVAPLRLLNTGQVWLDEIGLYYYKARFYDPAIKRFLNTDPIGYAAGMNMYAYVSGDPVNLDDPNNQSFTFKSLTDWWPYYLEFTLYCQSIWGNRHAIWGNRHVRK